MVILIEVYIFESHYLLAFLEGLALILSQCILQILPFMLATGLNGGKKKPFGIILGFITIFTLLTITFRDIIKQSAICHDSLNKIAFALFIIMGLFMIFESLSKYFSKITQKFSNVSGYSSKLSTEGFLSGFFTGSLISFIWTPCAGPILATVILQAITSQTNYSSYLILASFAIGVSIPMLAITILGKKLMKHTRFLNSKSIQIKKLFGFVIIISAITFGWTNIFQNKLLNHLQLHLNKAKLHLKITLYYK